MPTSLLQETPPANLVSQGIAALKSGDQHAARALLVQALEREPDNVLAWLWLSGAVASDGERRYCLDRVLERDPGHQAAAAGRARLAAGIEPCSPLRAASLGHQPREEAAAWLPELPRRAQNDSSPLASRIADVPALAGPPTADLSEAQPSEGLACRKCGQPAEEGYQLPLCSACRDRYSARPLPIWLKLSTALLGAVLLAALARFPAALGDGVAYARGQKAEAAGDYRAAASAFEQVAARYPSSTDLLVHLAVVEFRAGRIAQANDALNRLEGHQVTDAQYEQLTAIDDVLTR